MTDSPPTIDRIAEIERILKDPEVLSNREYADFKANALEDMKILLSEVRRLQAELTQAQDLLAKVQDGLTRQLYEATQPK